MTSDDRDDRANKGKTESNKVDRASADSFPASDPPSHSGITGAEQPNDRASRPPSDERGEDARPTGLPTDDRHAQETAKQWEDQERPDKPAKGRGQGQRT